LRMSEEGDLFKRMDTTKKLYIKTQSPEEAKEKEIPHIVRLPVGAAPEYNELTSIQQMGWRVFGKMVTNKNKVDLEFEDMMAKSHLRIRPEEYMAYVYMMTFIVAIVGIMLGVIVGIVLFGMMGVGIIMQLMVLIGLAGVLPFMTLTVLKGSPGGKAKRIGRDIDKRLPSAMSFISAMASADVNIDVIFKELARQPIYGEIRVEAEWITRDTELLGIDILSAIKKATTRTPSKKFQDFMQGVITTSTSGGQLKPYFLIKAEEYEKDSKLEMKSRMETLGLLAETFVTVVVAFPLFLVVILAIMAIVGGNASGTVLILYLVVLLMIPLAQFGFIFIIWNSEKESAT
jgi:archaeal flagellar protein FlaJ